MSAPETVGRYQIVGHLATGGMAEILLGKLLGPSGFERAVVIKRILPHLAREPRFLQMFLDEARIVARIRHPNVVQVHELGQAGEELFLVMEYLDGETASGLTRRLRTVSEALPWGLGAHVVAEACAGLHAAHELADEDGHAEGLVHRDVSPQNVLVLYDGQVKVLDFGIAKAADSTVRTEAGQIKGKFAYMSPEQCRGEALDRRSDVFSLGIVLFELTTGRRLFARDGDLGSLKAITEEPMVRPSQIIPGYPPRLELVCMRALARLREDRYQTALEMRRDLLAVMRELIADPVPEDVLGRLMRRIFADRAAQKHEMLRRIRSGVNVVSMPSAEADASVDIPIVIEDSNIKRSIPLPSTHPVPHEGSAEPQRRRSGLAFAGAAIVLLALGYAGWLAARPPETAAGATPDPTTAGPPTAGESAAESPSAAGTTTPSAVDPPSPITVHVESTPDGATILRDGVDVGTTPGAVVLPRGDGPIALELALDGYRTRVEEIVPDVDQRVRSTLERLPAKRGRGGSAASMAAEAAPAMDPGAGFRRFD